MNRMDIAEIVSKRSVQWAVLVAGSMSGACAQVTPEPPRDPGAVAQNPQADTARKGRARFFDPADGQFDLSNLLENPKGFLPIPIIVTEPAVGYGGGAVGMFLRPRRDAGEEGWARPNISAAGALATQNGTKAAFAGDASRWLDGRLRTLVGAGTGQVNLDFYGLGSDPATAGQSRSGTRPRHCFGTREEAQEKRS